MNVVPRKEDELPTSNRFLFNINAEDSIKRSTTLLESILGKTLNRLKSNSQTQKKPVEQSGFSLSMPGKDQAAEVKSSLQTIKVNPKPKGSPKDTADTSLRAEAGKTDKSPIQKESNRRQTPMKTESLSHSYSKYAGRSDKLSEAFDLRVIKVPQAEDDSISRDDSEAIGTLAKNLHFQARVDDAQASRQLAETSPNFKNMDYRRSMTENQPGKSPRQGSNRVMNVNKGRIHGIGEFSALSQQNSDSKSPGGMLKPIQPRNGSFGDLIPRDDAQRDSIQRSDLSVSQISKVSQTKNNTTERTSGPDPNKDSTDFYTTSLAGVASSESRTRVPSTSVSSNVKVEYEQLPRIGNKNKSASPKLDAIEEKPEPAISPSSSRPGVAKWGSSSTAGREKDSKINIMDCRPDEDTNLAKMQSEMELGANQSSLKQHSSVSSAARRDAVLPGKKGILVNKDRINAPSDLMSLQDFNNASKSQPISVQQSANKKAAEERVKFSEKPTVWLVQSYKAHMKGEDGTSCCENCNLI